MQIERRQRFQSWRRRRDDGSGIVAVTFLGHIISEFHPGTVVEMKLLFYLYHEEHFISAQFFSTKSLHVQRIGATVNEKQSSPYDARRLSSKQTKKDYSFK